MMRANAGCRYQKLEVIFDSLPIYIQEVLGDPRKGKHVMEHFFKIDNTAVRYFAKYLTSDNNTLRQAYQHQYVIDASMCNAVLALRAARIYEHESRGERVKKLWQILCDDAISFQEILIKKHGTAHTLGNNYRHFQRKLEKYENTSYPAVVSGKHANKNAQKNDGKALQLLNDMFSTQQGKPTYSQVARQYEGFLQGKYEIINATIGEVYNPTDYAMIGPKTVYNYLAQWENRIATHAMRSGNRQEYMGAYKPHHDLEPPKFAGSIISVDDRQPPFAYEKTKRVWFYNGIDLASECFTCFVWGKTKESAAAKAKDLGPGMGGAKEGAKTILGSKIGRAIEANNARGKRIEAYYKPLRYELEKEELGWIPRHTAKSEANKTGPDVVPMLPYDDIVKIALSKLQSWNNRPHSRHTNKTRWEYFLENQHPQLQPINYRGILQYIGHKEKTSCNVGSVKLQNKRFLLGYNGKIALGNELIELMQKIEGKTIWAYWLDGNDGNVLAAHAYIDDVFICELHHVPRYQKARIEQTPKDTENREIMSSYVATLEAFAKSKKKQIEKVVVNRLVPAELNQKFQIRELATDNYLTKQHEKAEILPNPFEDDLNALESVFQFDLKDRF